MTIGAGREPWRGGHGEFTGSSGECQHFTYGGSGRRVVLLHGWPGYSYDWRHVVPLLAGSYEVVAPDFRGFGRSGLPDGPPTEVSGELPLAQDVSELLAHLGDDRAVCVGTDLGAVVAQRLARDYPEQVAGLVLINPSHAGVTPEQRAAVFGAGEGWYQDLHQLRWASQLVAHDRTTVRTYLAHFFDHWVGDHDALVAEEFDTIVDTFCQSGAFERSIAWYRSRRRERIALAALAPTPIGVPAQILWGEADPVAPLAWTRSLAAAFSDFTLTTLPGTGHFAPMERPAEVARAVDAAWRLAG